MIKLETERLLLLNSARVKPADVAAFLSANRNYFQPWSAKVGNEYYTAEFWQQKLAKNIVSEKEGTQAAFFIFLKEEPLNIVAQVNLTQISRGPFQSCYMGYMTGEKHTRKGIMHEALKEVTQFAFTNLHLHRIEANVMPRNEPSIKLLEKLGFEYEGLALKYLKINGVWEDHRHYSIRNKKME